MIEFEDVSFAYDPAPRSGRKGRKRRSQMDEPAAQPRWALAGLDFRIEDGECFGIAGHTGSGKSTLVQLMDGLLQPTRGIVRVDGRSLADKEAAAEARQRVGLVFQYPERQLFAATVFEDVAFGPRNLDLADAEVESRVREALELVHLDADGIGPRSPFALSGGQQRRVALAGVLAMRPATLVLDEPGAGLDPLARRRLLELVDELHHGRALGVVVVSHDMDGLATLCDRILVLDDGRLHAIGTPAEVFADEAALRAIGLDVPQATGFANGLAARGVALSLGTGVPTLDELADAVAARYRRDSQTR